MSDSSVSQSGCIRFAFARQMLTTVADDARTILSLGLLSTIALSVFDSTGVHPVRYSTRLATLFLVNALRDFVSLTLLRTNGF